VKGRGFEKKKLHHVNACQAVLQVIYGPPDTTVSGAGDVGFNHLKTNKIKRKRKKKDSEKNITK